MSEGKEINYEHKKEQQYLSAGSNLSTDDSLMILKCRIRDLDVRGNFPNAYNDTICPFPQCTDYESQYHLASCEYYCDDSVIPEGLEYGDLFKSKVEKQHQITKILMKRMSIRNSRFSSNSRSSCGPVDPRRDRGPVSRGTRDNTRHTSRPALSLVIRGRRRKQSSRTISKSQNIIRLKVNSR